MKEGLLWFDNDPKTKLDDKVKRAARHYQMKLRRKPTVCYVNDGAFSPAKATVKGIDIKPAVYIRPHHFWLGVEHEAGAAKRA